ncbi:MAG TPA: OmpA family protein [Chiayiivirga sp.]|nr:OmpA family protein [Chiayiivirga sp.]HRP73850.1 OmpA family protein [Luteimonas sp.]
MNRIVSSPASAGLVFVTTLLLGACASKPPAPEPAPEPAPLPARATIEKLSADGLFAFGKAAIDEASAGAAELEALATRLAAGPQPVKTVNVIGHSDRIGNDKANLALSTRRAQAVRDYLLARGVEPGLITAVGRGSVEPVVECEGERGDALIACLAPNRRVEVRVSYGE